MKFHVHSYRFLTTPLMILLLFASPSLWAGRDGNGGNAIVCRDGSGKILTAELFDYYEGRVLRNISIDLGANTLPYVDKIKVVLERLSRISPVRAKLYRAQLDNFMSEAKFISGVQLVLIPDAEPTLLPPGCAIEQLAVQRDPIFPGDRRFIVNEDIWNHLDGNSKAGLILHELIYREALSYGHKTSLFVRYFNTFISSPSLMSTITTHKQIYDLMKLVKFLVTDFYGIRITLSSCFPDHTDSCGRNRNDSEYDSELVTFSKSGSFTEGRVAFHGTDSVLIQGQSCRVGNKSLPVNFYEDGTVKNIDLLDTYKDSLTNIEFRDVIVFSQKGRVLSGHASPFLHHIGGLAMTGRTSLSEDGRILSSRLVSAQVGGANFYLQGKFKSSPEVSLTPEGVISEIRYFEIDPRSSFIISGKSKLPIQNILVNGYTKPFVFENGKLVRGFSTSTDPNVTFQVEIQGQSIPLSNLELYENSRPQSFSLAQPSVDLTVGNQQVQFKGCVGTRAQCGGKYAIYLFDKPGDIVSAGILNRDTELRLQTGKKKKFKAWTRVHFNEAGEVKTGDL